MAGFESVSSADPAGGMAGFEINSERKYRPTVTSQSKPET
jgi:hypothetical protein